MKNAKKTDTEDASSLSIGDESKSRRSVREKIAAVITIF
jgi:hypothetical protein